MDNDVTDLIDFISQTEPFSALDNQQKQGLVKLIKITYIRAGEKLCQDDFNNDNLFIIRKGAINHWQIESANKLLLGKYGEGDICTALCSCQLTNQSDPKEREKHSKSQIIAAEDCLLYVIHWPDLAEQLHNNKFVLRYFLESSAQKLKHKVKQISNDAIVNATLMNQTIADFYNAPAVSVDINTSITQAAKTMAEHGFSSLLITNQEQLVGIVTDKDLRNRCLANKLNPDSAIGSIMTEQLLTIDHQANAFDALQQMSAKQVHHLPVMAQGKLCGMLSAADLMRQEQRNAINVSARLHHAQSLDELIDASKLIPQLQLKMTKMGTTASHVGKTISAIANTLTCRLIEMAEQTLGSPPCRYAWIAAGSQARREQGAHSDQDNALIIADDIQPSDDAWFKALAEFVCDGLNACGIVYCPGHIMATNPQWRQPSSVWHQYFQQWIETPDPKALLNCSVFFDMALVYGDAELLHDVRSQMLQRTQVNTLFLAHLSKNALLHRPPLGFFRDFVLEKDGNNKNTLDLKHKGLAPIVDLARIYALAEGVAEVGTIERLNAIAGSVSLTQKSADDLIDAFEFMGMLRLEHQMTQLELHQPADNYLNPKKLSRLERDHLKHAFKIVQSLQDVRQSAYG
ncbi:putative nucleotidyltransferase substrate binding domain-containing protein [Thalassotalea maritima]|uniref:putative nucleotidyltransferase substrate binding domain-containing protein n=1 Tax=Thalassotalea maritima TaxID=3242416 RepID=UPI0035273240